MLKKILYLLDNKNKKALIMLVVMALFLSAIETIGVGAIMPFLSLVTDETLIQKNNYFHMVYLFFNFTSNQSFIIYAGVLLIIFYMIRALYNIVYTYILNKFTMNIYAKFSYNLFVKYLHMPYTQFVHLNSGTISKTIITEASHLAALIQNSLLLISESLVVVLIYCVLLITDSMITLMITLFLLSVVLILKYTVSYKIKIYGEQKSYTSDQFYKKVNESVGNFKIIKFISNYNQLFNDFNNIVKYYAEVHYKSNTLLVVPRNILESVGMSLLVLIILYTIYFTNDVSIIVAKITLYALSLYRLLPAITKILSSYNLIIFFKSSLDIIYKDLNIYYAKEYANHIMLKNAIKLNSISFSYNSKKNVLNNIDLEIKKGQSIAFIGESGSGKSTLVDIICGLYRPDSGKILIDDIELSNDNIVSWRKMIGYIPQSIYLFDGTIAENISFGRDYDEEKIINVLKQANIYDTIMQKDGLDTKVGEGGIQLSGGQKQRIGIARALYGDPEILVLDEATSALDTTTETAIMDEIYKVSKDKTLIIIAHRLSTIERCDIKIDVSQINEK